MNDIEKAIEYLKEPIGKSLTEHNEAINLAISALEEKLSGGWIPVSDGLPEIDDTYLCTMDGEICGIDEPFTSMCGFQKGKWDEEGYVIAWKLMPEPHKEVENE